MLVTAVFDCMVFLQGAAKANGPSASCLELVEAGHVQLFFSAEIEREVRDVLSRPKIRKKFSALTDSRVEDFLNRIREIVTVQDYIPATFSLERDPKDEKYLNLAAVTSASYLVSRDKDLLDLGLPNNPEHEQFVNHCGNTRMVDPVAFLQIVNDLAVQQDSDSSR